MVLKDARLLWIIDYINAHATSTPLAIKTTKAIDM
jgi:3-oxoacyl-(acyl-carrier-protein) synthase